MTDEQFKEHMEAMDEQRKLLQGINDGLVMMAEAEVRIAEQQSQMLGELMGGKKKTDRGEMTDWWRHVAGPLQGEEGAESAGESEIAQETTIPGVIRRR
jgi:hypothetical protein